MDIGKSFDQTSSPYKHIFFPLECSLASRLSWIVFTEAEMPDSSTFSTISKKTGKLPEKMLFRQGFVTVGMRAKDTAPRASPFINFLLENS